MADFSALCEGTLISQLATDTTTGVTVQLKKVNELYSTVTWPTGAHEIMLVRQSEDGLLAERIVVASGTTQSNTTGVVTLGTLTRNCSLTDGTDTTGTAATITWPPSTLVYVTWGIRDADQSLFKNEVNTLTGSGAIRSSSTTTPIIRLNSVTTTQRNNMTPGNGDMVYDSTLGQFYKYEGGAWAAIATGTFSNAANNTAGKVDIASAAEIGAGTATDATSGAINVIPVSQTAKTSAGAGDENKLPILDSAGSLATGFLPTVPVTKGGTGLTTATTAYAPIFAGTTATGAFQAGTAGTTDQVLTSNGASAIATFQTPKDYIKVILCSSATSTTLTNPTTVTNFDTYTGTVPANFLTATTGGRFKIYFSGNRGTTTTVTVSFRLGNSNISSFALGSAGSGGFSGILEGTFHGTATPGGSVTVTSSNVGYLASSLVMTQGSNTVATNGALTAQFGAVFGTTSGGNDITINHGYIELFSQTASTFA